MNLLWIIPIVVVLAFFLTWWMEGPEFIEWVKRFGRP
jgi:hypothetical protein